MSEEKFQNKYRIPSARAEWWDYAANAAYFVTICTANKEHYFGDIENSEMKLSEIGQIANDYWLKIPQHFSFVILGEFIVMPNHVHGIIIIDKNDDEQTNVGTANVETPKLGVSTTGCETKTTGGKNDKWYAGTLGVIINQYKRICTIHSRKIHADFAWQTRFHDHIIRNNDEYQHIENYILTNPENWETDKFYNNEI